MERIEQQKAMDTPLFFVMNGTAILPIIGLPFFWSSTYLYVFVAYMIFSMFLAFSKLSMMDWVKIMTAKVLTEGNHPVEAKRRWKPRHRL